MILGLEASSEAGVEPKFTNHLVQQRNLVCCQDSALPIFLLFSIPCLQWLNESYASL